MSATAPLAALPIEGLQVSGGVASRVVRTTPEETPIALVHDGGTSAVMMATPADIEDLAIGFSLTEGIVDSLGEIGRLEVVEAELGIEARMWLLGDRSARLAARRRRMAGPTGCGLCGVDSLEEAARPLPPVQRDLRLTAADIHAAMVAMTRAQALGAATRATHAAAWWSPAAGLALIREDVGRHNALDKLAGALARATPPARTAGAVLLTSRVSVEMVQKAVMIGAEAIVAVSAPTALAVRQAQAAGLTLIGVARDDAFTVFSQAWRLSDPDPALAAPPPGRRGVVQPLP